MFNMYRWQAGPALLVVFGMSASAVAPLVTTAPALAQSTFYDIQGNWAQACVEDLARRNVISGYPDGSFRPGSPVSRAEFAAMVRRAFPAAAQTRNSVQFADVPSDYWAYTSIQEAYRTGFLSGYPGNVFNPNQKIPRAQVLVSLASGLNYTPTGSVTTTLNASFEDAGAIPEYAQSAIAAATQRQLVVNYPNVKVLNPNQLASRADVASFLCQGLRGTERASLVPSQYVAGTSSSMLQLAAGTSIPVRYDKAERIIVAPNETTPLTLTVARDVMSQGTVLIPANAQVVGQLQPASGGSQFVARELVINGQQTQINASSNVVSTTRSVRDRDFKAILGGAALGAGAAAGISAITGDNNINAAEVLTGAGVGAGAGASKNRKITSVLRDIAIGAAVGTGISAVTGDRTIATDEVVGGAAAGATIGGIVDRQVDQVVVIAPNTDLTLALNTDLTLQR